MVPARPRRHRSLVTLSRLLPFPLKEAAAPGAQRTRLVSPAPGTLGRSPATPGFPLLSRMQQHLRALGPRPRQTCRPTGWSARSADAGRWLTPPTRTGRPAKASQPHAVGSHRPKAAGDSGARPLSAGLSPSRGSTGAGTQGAIWESSKTRIQMLRSLCPNPGGSGLGWRALAALPSYETHGFRHRSLKRQVPKRSRLRDQVSLLNLSL